MQVRQIDFAGSQSKFIAWLQKKMPKATEISIANIERSGSGLSNETFLFDLSWKEGGKPQSGGLVLRLPPKSFPVHPQYELNNQFRVMEILGKTNIPVPRVYWMEEDVEVLGAPFYVMGKLKGTVPPDYPPYHSFGMYFDAIPAQRAKIWWGSVNAMADVHKLDWKKLGFSFLGVPKGGTDPIDRRLDYLERFLNWIKEDPGESQPVLEASLKWLKENHYVPEHVTLCWGDSRPPNTMYDQDYNVVAVLDWEMAFIGDPESDLAWFLFMDWQHSEGVGIPRLEGSPSVEETVSHYEKRTGFKVKNSFYNEVLNAFWYGMIMARIYKNFKKMGVVIPGDQDEYNSPGHMRLASLLNLEAPRTVRQVTKVEETTAIVQFSLTGEGASEWYLICEKGQATRHEGKAEKPTCTLIMEAEDWAAVQRGELQRSTAYMTGKLKIEGDMTLLLQLEDAISRFTKSG